MEKPKIHSDYKYRPILYGHELPQEQRAEFDWIESDEEYESSQFIIYKGQYYALSEFMCFAYGMNFSDKNTHGIWHGYFGEHYFSALYIHISRCGNAYKIARVY